MVEPVLVFLWFSGVWYLLVVQKSQTTTWDGAKTRRKSWDKLPFPQLVSRISSINSSFGGFCPWFFFSNFYHFKDGKTNNWGNEQKDGGGKKMVFSLAERRRIGGLKIELVRYNMRFCMIRNSFKNGICIIWLLKPRIQNALSSK